MKENILKKEENAGLEKTDGIDKIPIEIWLVTGMISFVGIVLGVYDFAGYYYFGFSTGAIAIYFTIFALVLAASIHFIKDKIKKGLFWQNSIIKWTLRSIEYTKEGYRNKEGKISNLFLAKMILLCWAVALIGFQIILNLRLSDTFFVALVLLVGAILVIFRIGADINSVRKAREEIAKGNFGYKIDVKSVMFPLRKSATELNSIGEAISLAVEEKLKAVEEKLKSERLKTTLITNVSHDIKTPLTSIINYANLMDKEKTKNKQMAEYIEVLVRQSNKLKKMTEDLIDASKASSGAMEVNLMEMDVETILTQTVGEYKESLEEAGLEAILTAPKESARIMCDDRLITRVLENLFSNICKYSMEGTRVYISSYIEGEQVYMSFKNISKVLLNITPEELKERFIRGDESRSEEGNGLGLNIADSFTKIQNGKLDIDIDGDLFKATLSFATII